MLPQNTNTASSNQNMAAPGCVPSTAPFGDYRKSLALLPGTTTLYALRGGTAGNIKMQGPDNVVECVKGTLGDQSFKVRQMPDQAGLALGGAALLGIDALRERLKTFRYFIKTINYSATTTAQLNSGPSIHFANIDGSSGVDVYATAQDVSNMQNITTLLTLTKPVELNSNNAIQLASAASEAIELAITWSGRGNYNF